MLGMGVVISIAYTLCHRANFSGVFAASAKGILRPGLPRLAAVVSLHSLGFLNGYYLACTVGYLECT